MRRLLIHVQDTFLDGCTNCLVRTVDTDVVAILIGKFHQLITLCQDVNMRVAFGTGKNFTYYHIDAIYDYSGRAKSLALTVSHSVTGCDITSSYFGKGKRSAWEAWLFHQDVTYAFTRISLHLYTAVEVDAQDFQLLECFSVVLYDKASDLEHVDEVRKELVFQKGITMETLPPTQDALSDYCSIVNELYIRVEYGAPAIRVSNMPLNSQMINCPDGWGWTLVE